MSAHYWFLRLSMLVLCSWAISTSPVRAGETAPAELVVLDFTTPPVFSFLSWENKPQMADGALRLQVPDGRGGCGYIIQRDLTAFAERTPVLTVTMGQGNRSKSLRVTFQDADGTEHNYLFALAGVAAGAHCRHSSPTMALHCRSQAARARPASRTDSISHRSPMWYSWENGVTLLST